MKFCNKLSKQRKNNNMSQEQLADKLGVSRQAVSKWESGTAMPDMAKILELCKILNCNLDDLVDDGTFNGTKQKETKININTYMQEVLDFITKTLNMFWSMRLVEKIKCILEMAFITIVMYLIWLAAGYIIYSIFNGIIYTLPSKVYRFIYHISSIIYSVFGLIVGAIIFIHIFKIRYLDYFVTIEDNNSIDKKIEKPVDEQKEDKERKFIEHKKNKIIIRDPKHSTYSFFNVLAHIVIWFIKFILIFIAFLAVISFIFIVFSATFSIWKISKGIFFLGTTIILLGCLIVNFIILMMIYNFIFNQKYKFKKIFYLFIIGFILIGVGSGISFCTYLTFDKEETKAEYTTYEQTINMEDNILIDFLEDYRTEIVEDNNIDNIKIEITHNKDYNISIDKYSNSECDYYNDNYKCKNYTIYDIYYYNHYYDTFDTFNYLIDKIEKKIRVDINDDITISKYKITISKENLEKLKTNYNKYFDD